MSARTFLIPLPGGKDISVTGDFPLTDQDWVHLLSVLEAMKPGLVKIRIELGEQQ